MQELVCLYPTLPPPRAMTRLLNTWPILSSTTTTTRHTNSPQLRIWQVGPSGVGNPLPIAFLFALGLPPRQEVEG
jgi:hypothetical protein